MYLINQNPLRYVLLGWKKQATTKGTRTEMHFTIIQAESRDKVKIIIIFNNILFSAFPVENRSSLLFGGTQCGAKCFMIN